MAAVLPATTDRARPPRLDLPLAAVDARGLVQRFGALTALDGVSLAVPRGGIHALLGPNGAGKTTLIRILSGLLAPGAGDVLLLGRALDSAREFRRLVGLVPSGDRSFYLRISGLENLVFFARLHGYRRRDAVRRASALLADVGLEEAAARPVGHYSHGMQKRLSVARALLADPSVLLVDEATHDLDPEGARRVRELALAAASRGTAVVWATQRLEEIRGLADGVTLLARGKVAFEGSVAELLARATPRRYLVRLGDSSLLRAQAAVGTRARVEAVGAADSHVILDLADDAELGDAITALAAADIRVLTCREETSNIEEAFLAIAGADE